MRGLKTLSVVLLSVMTLACVARAGIAREAVVDAVHTPNEVQVAAGDPVDTHADRAPPLSAKELDLKRLTRSRWQ
jgi:hypothetical protein